MTDSIPKNENEETALVDRGRFEAALSNSYLRRIIAAQERGEELTLDSCRDEFVGFEETITREHLRLSSDFEATLLRDPFSGRQDLPESVGRFLVDAKIGEGGMGVVFIGRDPVMKHRPVVIKTLKRAAELGSEPLRRLRDEATIAASLDDDGICPTLDLIEEEEGKVYVVMKYVDGRPLDSCCREAKKNREKDEPFFRALWRQLIHGGHEKSRKSRIDTSTKSLAVTLEPALGGLLYFIEELARSMHTAHSKGIVHRDLKPGNVMVRKDTRPVVIDFGLAVDLGSGDPRHTLEGLAMGTPYYMAPEQAAGRIKDIDARTDIYALGVVLYQLLSGELPHGAEGIENVLASILTEDPKPVRRHDKNIPRDLDAVCMKAMARSSENRFATALDFAEDLARVRMLQPTLSRPTGIVERSWRIGRRHPILSIAVAVALCAIALLSYTELQDQAGKEDQRDLIHTMEGFSSLSFEERADQLRRFTNDEVAIASLARDPDSSESQLELLKLMSSLNRDSGRRLLQPRGYFRRLPEKLVFRDLAGQPDLYFHRVTVSVNGKEARVLDLTDARPDDEDIIEYPFPQDLDLDYFENIADVNWRVDVVAQVTGEIDPNIAASDNEASFFVTDAELGASILADLQPTGDSAFDHLVRAAHLIDNREELPLAHDALRELEAVSDDAPEPIVRRRDLLRIKALHHAYREDEARTLAETVGIRSDDGK